MEDILTVVVIFVLDIIKTSVLCTPHNDFSLLDILQKAPLQMLDLVLNAPLNRPGCIRSGKVGGESFFFS